MMVVIKVETFKANLSYHKFRRHSSIQNILMKKGRKKKQKFKSNLKKFKLKKKRKQLNLNFVIQLENIYRKNKYKGEIKWNFVSYPTSKMRKELKN